MTYVKQRDNVDEAVVQRRIDGDASVRLNLGERELAVRLLNARGRSDSDIAIQIGMSRATVLRTRQRLGIPAAPQTKWSNP